MTVTRFAQLTAAAGVVAAVAIVLTVPTSAPPPEVEKARREAARDYVAESACKTAIGRKLREPKEAVYEVIDVSRVAVTRGPGTQVTIDVRSKNGYGAISETRVRCVLSDSGGPLTLAELVR